jgi:tRNA pseudouridine38-40 synthase
MDLDQDWRPEVVRDAINAYLIPEPISILKAEIAADDFSARYCAKGRRYLYRILNRRSPPALEQGRVWHMKRPLNAEAMHEAAQVLVGLHDFTTFRDLQCQAKSPVKSLDVARVWRQGDEVHLAFEARSFLHRQVRSMTGSIAQVGIGRWTKADLAKALEAKDRQACGVVAPPDGLYLVGVEY